ncbi:MAG: hypothetical protein IKF19_03265 [Bacilli bacterium]|nr:hypothetical protein [Bacilli bacterium]
MIRVRSILVKVLICISFFALVCLVYNPIVALAFGSTETLTITFRDNYEEEQGYVEYSLNDGASWVKVTSNINNQSITMAGDNLKIRVVPNDGYYVDFAGMSYRENNGEPLMLNENENSAIAGGLTSQNGYQVTGSATNVSLEMVEFGGNSGGGQEQGDPNEGQPFDGKAYLIWSCENGGVCYHHFTNIPNFDDGKSAFYKASDTKDDRTNEAFKVDAKYKGWATDNIFNNWVALYKTFKNIEGDIDWTTVNPQDIIGDPLDMRQYEEQAISAGVCTREGVEREEFEHCVDEYVISQGIWSLRARLQPLPDEPTDNNAYVSYGDRNFKVVIYNDNYKGIAIGNLTELSYYPAYYTNQFVRQDQFDISGTSKSKPTIVDSILLEKTVTIKTLNYNSFSISKIEAIGVPNNAVTISKTNDEYKLVFTSNFYDNVLFKVTDSNGGVEYFKVHRYTIDGNLRHMNNKPTIVADFYFDRNKTYTDFNITAKILYKNGTTKNKKMTAVKEIDDGLGNIIREYEVDEQSQGEFGVFGKGLKRSTFTYELNQGEEETISKVYLNVEYKGSTSTNYAGAFTGAGKGVEIDFGEGE